MRLARPALLALVGACALLALAAAYWPGLSGPFLLDDYANLDALGSYGRIHDLPSLLFYLSSGGGDPLGRPLALLTFLLDAQQWPADPWPFKRTNLLLHLLNTAMLASAVGRLQAAHARSRPLHSASSPWTPLAAAMLWGAHPFFVSTTLYVVQREAMLPATFVLLGLLAWQRAITLFARQRTRAAWAWATLGLGGCTLLATLCKANGVLTPLLAGVAYLVLLRPASPADATRRTMDRAALLCLALPAFVVVGYLIHIAMLAWPLPRIPGRDWSLTERLLSEPRVLCQYLWRLALPRAVGGLYGDAFPPSRGWTAPWTTLPSLLALLAITSTALLARHRAPIACFAWCFFLVGHLLESTTVPLELYFEHRNYVPALFLGWPIAHSLLRPGTYSRYRVVALGLLLAAWLLLTAQRASLWGNAQLLHAVAARSEEGSPRAQFFAAMDAHDPRDALARMHRAQRLAPDSMDLAIGSIALECETRGALDPATLAAARQTLATSHTWNYRLAQWLQEAPSWRDLRDCRGLGLDGLSSLLDAAASNPGMTGPRRRRDLDNARGRIALAAGQPDKALRWFDAALSEEPDPDYALVQAAALGDASAPALGVRHLDTFARLNVHRAAPPVRDMTSLHTWLLSHYGYYRHETALLRVALQRAAEDQAHSTPSTRR